MGLLKGYSSCSVVSRLPLIHQLDVINNNVCQSDGTLCGLFKQSGNQVGKEIYTYLNPKVICGFIECLVFSVKICHVTPVS